MLTQDQKDAIMGAGTFEFETEIGCGRGAVVVRLTYEYDSSGSYNETVDTIRTYSDFPIIDYLEESTIDELCILGCKLLNESKENI